MFPQHRACPFPRTPEVALAGEPASILGDRRGMPMVEADIAILEVGEELARIWLVLGTNQTVE